MTVIELFGIHPPVLNFYLLSFPHVNMPQAVSNNAKDEDPEADVSDVSSPTSLPAISLLSPKAMETAGRIIQFEEEQRGKAKVRQNFLFIFFISFCVLFPVLVLYQDHF